MRITLFIKPDKPMVKEVIDYLVKHLGTVTVYQAERNDPFPKKAFNGSPDILISYLSPWIIPGRILNSTKFWNINFHPGPPEYPGIGCFNFAIYDKKKIYGVTAHLMNEKVDSGRIIGVKKFPLLKSDSVYSLSMKSYEHMLSLFLKVMDFILKKKKLPHCNETWKRAPYTRKELDALCKLDPNMTKSEIERRVKATTYPDMPGAYMNISGYRFECSSSR